MHRTEGPDEILESGKRRYKETPAPGTVVNKFHANAFQEEICLAIENVGITLNATGVSDRSAGWGQLHKAIQRNVFANVLAFGADPTGAADSKTAIDAALAWSKIIYFPPGTYKFTGTLTVPDGSFFLGAGENQTILKPDGAAQKFPNNVTMAFRDLKFDSALCDEYVIQQINTLAKNLYLDHVSIQSPKFGISFALSGTDELGFLIMNNVVIDGVRSGGTGIQLGTATYRSTVLIDKLYMTVLNSADEAIEIIGSSSVALLRVSNSRIIGGKLLFPSAERFIFQNNFLDVDEYKFTGTDVAIMKNNIIGDSENNTVTNDDGTASRTLWIGNRLDTGKINGSANINGIKTERSRITTDQTVAATTQTNAIFNGETAADRIMANHTTYTKDDPWDSGNYRFDVFGYGNGYVNIYVNLIIDGDTSDADKVGLLNCFIGVNGTKIYTLPRLLQVEHATTGRWLFTGSLHVPVEISDTVEVIIDNDGATSVDLQIGSSVVIEGL